MREMDSLPEELLVSIVEDFPCRALYFLKNVNKKFRDAINNNDLMEKRKKKGYPRAIGHSAEFDVEKGADLDRLDLELDKLYAKNINLVRGDLITFWLEDNHHILYIFDGCKIINLTRHKQYLFLPAEFNTITNSVPLNYWENDEFYCGFRGNNYDNDRIYLNVVWLDISQIKDELLCNIRVKFGWYVSKFTSNNIEYKLRFGSAKDTNIYDEINNNNILRFTSYRNNHLYQ